LERQVKRDVGRGVGETIRGAGRGAGGAGGAKTDVGFRVPLERQVKRDFGMGVGKASDIGGGKGGATNRARPGPLDHICEAADAVWEEGRLLALLGAAGITRVGGREPEQRTGARVPEMEGWWAL